MRLTRLLRMRRTKMTDLSIASAEMHARDILRQLHIKTFPVNIFKVADALDYKYKSLDDIRDLGSAAAQNFASIFASAEIDAIHIPDLNNLIVYDPSKPAGRISFSVAHEIGHIYEGHKPNGRNGIAHRLTPAQERQANAFAAELLRPTAVFQMFPRHNCTTFSDWFGVTLACAEVGKNRARKLPQNFATQQFYWNRFCDFFHLYKCPYCGFELVTFDKDPYCPDCLNTMARYCQYDSSYFDFLDYEDRA